jgi:predicted CopG family antitoxin
MGTKMVRLDEDVYEWIKSQKRDDETFSEAIARLTSEYTLVDFAEDDPVVDPDRHRAALEALTERGKQETRERLAALEETDG